MPRGRPSSKARASALAAEAATAAAEAAPSPKVSAKAAPTTPKVSAKAVASPAKSPKEIVQSPAKLADMAFEEGDEVMAKWPGMYSCNKITTTWIQISRQDWNGLFLKC